jgi:hypothetical protein
MHSYNQQYGSHMNRRADRNMFSQGYMYLELDEGYNVPRDEAE